MNPIVQKGELYSGCYARVCVSLFPYNSNGKRGIGIGLEAVQKLRDGDPLGGGVSVADAFGQGAPAQPVQQYQQPAPAQYQQPMMQYGAAPQQPMQYGAVDPITGLPL